MLLLLCAAFVGGITFLLTYFASPKNNVAIATLAGGAAAGSTLVAMNDLLLA